ncbi:MAG TPA: L-rhamnose mutarotase [Chitinophagaceae bacterium]|nr:L-rhamnose mutarotase [Chitinophagaceae bacterium]
MERYCLALDLKNDPRLIAEYDRYHQSVWPEILQSLRDSGITRMEIYRTGNRLFLIMEGNENFSLEKKAVMDGANPKVQDWEQLMWKYQQALPWAVKGQKWVRMEKVFEL